MRFLWLHDRDAAARPVADVPGVKVIVMGARPGGRGLVERVHLRADGPRPERCRGEHRSRRVQEGVPSREA